MVRSIGTDITIVPSDKLDVDKWNSCALNSNNGSLFLTHEYLSGMAPAWSGLIIGDYDAILPLTYKRKFGIKYLAALPFVKQMGLTGQWNAELEVEDLFNAVHRYARYGDICFSHQNQFLVADNAKPFANYELDLNRSYAAIFEGYHKTYRTRLNKIKKNKTLFFEPAKASDVVEHYEAFLKDKIDIDLSADFNRLAQLVLTEFGRRYFVPYKIVDKEGALLLHGLYGKDDCRIYNFMTAVTPEGRKLNASAFAVDYLIINYAGSERVFDFMGSSLPGVRSFIESFGAVNRPYYVYHFNKLFWPLRLLKP